ncbi:MAG: hypothetical protein HKN43_07230 [Rhodothermales bacterium]|nr:hypothetical protein [Rhodothermales bacterium]
MMYPHPRKVFFTAAFVICFGISACSWSDSNIVEVFDLDGSSLGSVAIQTSCTEAANEHVRRGLALLHNMTYEEAAATFMLASTVDPYCAVAKWGEATSLFHPLWPDVPSAQILARGSALLEEGRNRNPSELDLAYIEAAEAYYNSENDPTEMERLHAYAAAWDNVSDEFPDDLEAKLFKALSMIAVSGDANDMVATRSAAGVVAEGVLAEVPDHPGALHYTIHAYDLPQLADQALIEARKYGEVAPENSHALHMTSHIFTRVGSWDESITYNARAAEAALKHSDDEITTMHYFHAADYLVYAYLQQGNDVAATGVWNDVQDVAGPAQDHAGSAYAYAAIPARLTLERHNWADAKEINLSSPSSITWSKYPHLEAIIVFAQGMGAARTGDVASARDASARMQQLENSAAQLPGAYNWAEQVRIQRRALQAWTMYEEGDSAGALAEMRAAAELEATTTKNPVTPGEVLPAAELLGDMLLDLSQPEDALEAYEASLARNRNRLNSLYGAALASEELGDGQKARKYFQTIVSMADESADLEMITRARGFLNAT